MEWKAGPRRLLPSMTELVCFDAAARYGSFTQAAEALALTQAAVSKQVRRLEERLNIQLFKRAKKRVVLTDAGRSLKVQVREILDQVDCALNAIAPHSGEKVLKVAVLPTVANRWLMPRLPNFMNTRPGVVFDFATRLTRFDFDEDPFDCALQHGEPTWPKATTTILFEEEMLPVASHDYQTRLNVQTPHDLAKTVLIQHRLRSDLWAAWFAAFGLRNENASKGPHFDQFSMVVRAAVAGLGVALMPPFLIEDELRTARLKVLFDLPLRTNHKYFLAIPLKKGQDPVIAHFIRWLRGEAQHLNSLPPHRVSSS